MHIYHLIIKGWSSVGNLVTLAYLPQRVDVPKVTQFVRRCMESCPPISTPHSAMHALSRCVSSKHNVNLEVKEFGPLGDYQAFIIKSKGLNAVNQKAMNAFVEALPHINGSGNKVINGKVTVQI